jgi:hypothetical protein
LNIFCIKKGDTVKVIAGDDKGKTAEVLQVLRKEEKVLVKGVPLLVLVILVLAAVTIIAIYLVPQIPFPIHSTPTLQNMTLPQPRSISIVVSVREPLIEGSILFHYTHNEMLRIVEKWGDYEPLYSDRVKTLFHEANLTVVEEDYNISKESVRIRFYVTGKIWRSGDRVTADFLWLLNPFNLDFIESGFKETNHGLYWSGSFNGIPLSVSVELPPQPAPYAAWGSDVGHCHGHVWWKES